jgi:hypothetical protein
MARADVETIKQAKIGIAHDFEATEQRQAQCAADPADNFQRKRKAAQRLDANLDARFLFSGFFHLGSE